MFLDAGAKINVKNNDGITPLMKSVEMQRYQAMMSLMAAGADLNAVDAMDRKAIDFFIGAYNIKAWILCKNVVYEVCIERNHPIEWPSMEKSNGRRGIARLLPSAALHLGKE